MSSHGSTGSRRDLWRVVALREILVKVTDKSFIIGTLTSLALILGSVGFSIWLGDRAKTTDVVVTTAPAEQLATQVAAAEKSMRPKDTTHVKKLADVAAAEAALRDGSADVYLSQVDGHWQVTVKRGSNDGYTSMVQQTVMQTTLAQTAQKAGTSMEQVAAATRVDSTPLVGDSNRSDLARGMGLLFGMLFMMSAMTFGMQIAQSVIEEKQSRIVEILVAAIPVRQLLSGKVLGNTVMALGQMAVLVVTGLVAASFTPMKSMLPTMSGALAWYLVFFLGGFLALACLWAAIGALCSRNEDLQQAAQPMIWVIMIVYMAGFMATGTVRTVLSFVPVVSAVVMPVRLVEGSAAWWEPALALLATIAFAVATILFGERIYRRALLQTGGRIGWRKALQLTD